MINYSNYVVYSKFQKIIEWEVQKFSIFALLSHMDSLPYYQYLPSDYTLLQLFDLY